MLSADQSDLKLLLLSGPLSVGKSSVTAVLVAKHSYSKVRSGAYVASVATARGLPQNRNGLQEVGDSLDADTDYLWLLNDVAKPTIFATPCQRCWVIDAVRKDRQITHFRREFGASIYHVHLFAPEEVLRSRYEHRQKSGDDYVGDAPYDVAISHPNETAARSLLNIADTVIDIGERSPEETASLILRRITGVAL